MLASSRYLIGFIWLVTLTVWPSLDHLIRPLQERLGDRQAEGLGGLEVDDQLELGRLFDGKIAGLGSFEDLVHVGRGTPELVRNVRPIGNEARGLRKLPYSIHGGQPAPRRQLDDLTSRTKRDG